MAKRKTAAPDEPPNIHELLKRHMDLTARIKAALEEGMKLSGAGNKSAAAGMLAEAEKLQAQLAALEKSVKP